MEPAVARRPRTEPQRGELCVAVGWWQLVLLLAYPVYLLLMASVLRLIGAPKDEVVKWVLKQADRQRLTDLVRAARGLPPPEKDADAR
jgi:hypothetical protein